MAGPLNGVRVVEVANWTFVPAAGAVLADLGADVIKVEPPNGDPQRALLNMLNLKGGGPNPFIEIPNRGKRSVTCDLTTDAGRQHAQTGESNGLQYVSERHVTLPHATRIGVSESVVVVVDDTPGPRGARSRQPEILHRNLRRNGCERAQFPSH